MAGTMRTAFVLALVAVAGMAAANPIGDLPDGLHTWTIEGTSDVQSCCFTWRRGEVSRRGCTLDGRTGWSSNRSDCDPGPGQAQVYVRVTGGTPADIWLLSSNCPVETADSIADHGIVSAGDNVAWFRKLIENRRAHKDIREDALFALVMSGTDAAFRYLDRLLSGNSGG